MPLLLVRRRTLVWCAAVLLMTSMAEAQPLRLPRADVSASIGWLNSNVSELGDRSDTWASHRATLNGQGGLYLTEHWKTELAAERSSVQRRWQTDTSYLPGGAAVFRALEHHVQDTRVTVGQWYQFGHNAWTHTLVGGGLSVTHRRVRTETQPLVRYDRNGEVLLEPASQQSSSTTRINPFVGAALKAYVTPRVFVRSDLQAEFRQELEAVVLRIGFGVDF